MNTHKPVLWYYSFLWKISNYLTTTHILLVTTWQYPRNHLMFYMGI